MKIIATSMLVDRKHGDRLKFRRRVVSISARDERAGKIHAYVLRSKDARREELLVVLIKVFKSFTSFMARKL